MYGLALLCFASVGVSGAMAQSAQSAANYRLLPNTPQEKALVVPTVNVTWRSSTDAVLAIKAETARIQNLASGNAAQETVHGATVAYYRQLLESVVGGTDVATSYLTSAASLTSIASRFAVTSNLDLLQIRRNALTLLTQ